jgi:hypothetical protein
MNSLFQATFSLVSRINALISRAESAFPGMQEAAAMVYVGDVYALRVLPRRQHTDGWGRYHYSCDTTGCKPLP